MLGSRNASVVPVDGIFEKSDGGWKLVHYRNSYAEERRSIEDQNNQAQAAEARKTEDREKLGSLMSRFGAKKVISCEAMVTNPFALEKEIVAVPIVFQSMLERDRALFLTEGLSTCAVVASSIPASTFSNNRIYALLFGQVIGRTEVKLYPGGGAIRRRVAYGLEGQELPRRGVYVPLLLGTMRMLLGTMRSEDASLGRCGLGGSSGQDSRSHLSFPSGSCALEGSLCAFGAGAHARRRCVRRSEGSRRAAENGLYVA